MYVKMYGPDQKVYGLGVKYTMYAILCMRNVYEKNLFSVVNAAAALQPQVRKVTL